MVLAFKKLGHRKNKLFAIEECFFLPVRCVLQISHVGHLDRNVVFMGYKI
jgi:hypothetical protein